MNPEGRPRSVATSDDAERDTAAPQHAVVVVNPTAGSVTTELVETVSALLADTVERVEIVHTARRGDAEQLAADAALAGAGLVVAVGGDGTVREVVEGLTQRCLGRPTMLVVPAGTGNSNYRAHWGDRPWDDAVRLVTHGGAVRRQVDVAWLVELDQAVMLGAGSGLIEATLSAAAQVRHTGRDRYRAALDLAIAQHEPYRGQVTVDGHVVHTGPTSLVNVGGGRFRGGSFEVLPTSELDDGLLDVCIVDDSVDVATLPDLMRRGAHVDLPGVTCARGRTVIVQRTDGHPLTYEHDGEPTPADNDRFTMTLLPGSLPVWCASDVPGFGGRDRSVVRSG